MQETDLPSDESETPTVDRPAKNVRRYLLVGAVALAAVVALPALLYKSDSYYTLEGIRLGMTNARVLEALPTAGPFKKASIIGEDGVAIMTFESLEPSPAPKPWSRFLVGSVEGVVVSVSTRVFDLPIDKADALLEEAVARYGKPDDTQRTGEGEFWVEVHTWGDVSYEEDDRIFIRPEVSGRAVIFRQSSNGTVSILVTRDNAGPHV